MPRRSTVALAIVGAAFVTWLAAASSNGLHGTQPVLPAVQESPARAEALLADVARLHERLEETPVLIRPTRNPFRFASVRASAASPRPTSTPAATSGTAASVSDSAPALSLVGMAEDEGPDGGTQRTAIVASAAEIFLVKAGDAVGPQYRVLRIDAGTIELVRLADASVVRLALK